ncbi:MAG TPA: HAD family phosphatase [Anaerolineales bacterium]|jgi:2-haloacid dehalogenase
MSETVARDQFSGNRLDNGLENKKPSLVFDFGGVLLDWDPRRLFIKLFDGDTEAMEKFITEVDFFGWNFEQDRGRTFAEGVAELSARFPHYAEVINAYDVRWEETMDGPIQATVDKLQPLKDNGHRLFALSNWSEEKYHFVNHKWPFFELFEAILISGQVRLAKPDPRFFEMMLEQIGRPATECVFIDDSAANVAAAGQMGFKTIHFKSTSQMLDEMEQMEIDFS